MAGYGQGVIPDDWEGEFCRYAVCWPNSPQWHAVLRGVLSIPAQGRFWDEHTGVIIQAQSVIRQTFDYNLHFQEVIMACGDGELHEIALALRAMANKSCCGGAGTPGGQGSGGAGSTTPELSPVEEGDPEIDPPPDGFETWEEYTLYKCAIAHNIIGQLRESLFQMGTVNFGAMTLDGIGIALAIIITLAIPAELIIAIAALIIAIGAEIVVVTALSLVNDHDEELICALYGGTSSGNSLALFHSVVATYADSGITDPVQNFAVKQFLKYMVNNAVTNRLYEKDLTRIWTEQDCSFCAPAWWSCAIGTVITHTVDTVDILGVDLGDFDYTTAVAYSNEAELGTLEAEIVEGSWSAPSDIPEFASAYDTDEEMCGVGAGGDWENAESGFQTGPVEARILQHRQNAPVTVRYTRVMP